MLLGLLFIYYIGKYFYELALLYDKPAWVYSVIGPVSFYLSQLVLGVFIGLSDEFLGTRILGEDNLMLNLAGIPVGFLGAFGLYRFLENKWSKGPKFLDSNDDILDDSIFID